jgi:hypothetical protein
MGLWERGIVGFQVITSVAINKSGRIIFKSDDGGSMFLRNDNVNKYI